jgi:acyl carrier protein
MDVTEGQVTELVYEVIDGINSQSSKKKKIEKRDDFLLYGDGGNLDSMDLVGLIVDVEQKITKNYGVSVALANEKSLSQTNSPFRSIGSLIEYAMVLLKDA